MQKFSINVSIFEFEYFLNLFSCFLFIFSFLFVFCLRVFIQKNEHSILFSTVLNDLCVTGLIICTLSKDRCHADMPRREISTVLKTKLVIWMFTEIGNNRLEDYIIQNSKLSWIDIISYSMAEKT